MDVKKKEDHITEHSSSPKSFTRTEKIRMSPPLPCLGNLRGDYVFRRDEKLEQILHVLDSFNGAEVDCDDVIIKFNEAIDELIQENSPNYQRTIALFKNICMNLPSLIDVLYELEFIR